MFANVTMKKQSSQVAYFSSIEEFSRIALICPYGQKLRINVENWVEKHSVISPLWLLPSSCLCFFFMSLFFF
jgi:hypothetical protein